MPFIQLKLSGERDPALARAAATRVTALTRQHLAARFRRELGLSPKLAARVIRFERAQRMLRAVPAHVTIAQVAASCGYYDQAHLNRDFAAFAGASPSRWAADERLPSFQDRLPEDL